MTHDPSQPPDVELGRILARGSPGGPEVDGLWARVEQSLDAQEHPKQTLAWRWRLMWASLAAAPALAVAVLMMVNAGAPPNGLVARGAGEGGAYAETTCGAAQSPCAPGQQVYVKLHAADHDVFAVVDLVDHQGEQRLYGPVKMLAGTSLTLPVELVPEAADVSTGLKLHIHTVRAGHPEQAAPAAAAIRTQDAGQDSVLIVRVKEPSP